MPSHAPGSLRTAAEAAAWLESLINVERMPDRRRARFSLAPIEALLTALGRPHEGLSVMHVAGSKGKGSTALFGEAVLRAAGRSVGTFTSPHLERWSERFRIDAVEVSGDRLAGAVERVRPHVEALRGGPDAPSFFDATTAAGLLLFAEAAVDHVILEVGLGGRLDSTNVVTPAVACVTSIELEHTEVLGESLAAIAAEKAGILKPGVPAVTGTLPAEAAEVIRKRAEALGAPLAELGRDFHVGEGRGGAHAFRDGSAGFEAELRLRSPGRHQAENAAVALAALARGGLLAPDALAVHAPRALEGVVLPGRIERLGERPSIVVDSAHTPASVRRLLEVLADEPHPAMRLVLSLSTGKDLARIAALLAPVFRAAVVTRADPHKSIEPGKLAAALRQVAPTLPVQILDDPEDALRAARAACDESELLCVTGSVYLAGIARRTLGGSSPAGPGGR